MENKYIKETKKILIISSVMFIPTICVIILTYINPQSINSKTLMSFLILYFLYFSIVILNIIITFFTSPTWDDYYGEDKKQFLLRAYKRYKKEKNYSKRYEVLHEIIACGYLHDEKIREQL